MPIERLVPGTSEWEAFYANHINRYRFALEILKKRKVCCLLDIACGVGYGSRFLAQLSVKQIIGVDISEEALQLALRCFSHPLVKYIVDDGQTMEKSRQYAPYDAIISFETLEHLQQPKQFLDNCYKNLSTGGCLIISTPNSCVSSADGHIKWDYHEKEYAPEEFLEMLNSIGFSEIQLFGQQYTETGKLREMIRGELYILHSNPFVRIGKWMQKVLKGHQFGALLPEQESDFEIVAYGSAQQISQQKKQGPFVLMAVAIKSEL